MKADRDDAPTYFRPSAHRSNGSTWIVASFLGSVLTVGMLYALSALYMHDVADRILNGQKQKPAPIAEITRSVPAEKDWDRIVEDVATRSRAAERPEINNQTQQPKQTDYSTATYVPAHAVNVIPARSTYTQPNSQSTKTQKEIVIIGQQKKLSDHCPFREGSIERRSCKANINLSTRN
nr:hypothetical protein [uncultured Pseudomonas sp.]